MGHPIDFVIPESVRDDSRMTNPKLLTPTYPR